MTLISIMPPDIVCHTMENENQHTQQPKSLSSPELNSNAHNYQISPNLVRSALTYTRVLIRPLWVELRAVCRAACMLLETFRRSLLETFWETFRRTLPETIWTSQLVRKFAVHCISSKFICVIGAFVYNRTFGAFGVPYLSSLQNTTCVR